MKTAKKNNNSIPLSKGIIAKIMNRGITIEREYAHACRDFRIMTSPLYQNTLILRWTTIDITDIDRPVQQYHYECFDSDGTAQGCSIHYTDRPQANAFFESLETLYAQECAIDHNL